jgi:hypothetical protein
MFFVEESIMLERVLSLSLPRFAVFLGPLLTVSVGCNSAETSLYGYVDVVPSGVRAAACEVPPTGHLQLDGLQGADVARVFAHEICHQWVVRKELPAGLYTVSWQPGDDGRNERATGQVRDAVIVNVFPEQATTVRLLPLTPERELLSQASPEARADLSSTGIGQW